MPSKISENLDFISVHIYPKSGKLDEARETLKDFSVGKPVLVEETFPLRCSAEQLNQFMEQSEDLVVGWVGFYWGKSIDECRQSRTIADALTAAWLELFKNKSAAKN